MSLDAPPDRRLPTSARTMWRVQGLAAWVGASAVALAMLGPYAVLVAVPLAVACAAVPEVRWRRWRYAVRETAIDLRHGTLVDRRTLVPIRRVQHVDTETGPLQSIFDLASVRFHTAAGTTRVPALTRDEAEAVRRRVGELANVRDDV